MESRLSEILETEIAQLNADGIAPRMDPDFARVVQESSDAHIREALANMGVPRERLDRLDRDTTALYRAELAAKERSGVALTPGTLFDRASYATFKTFLLALAEAGGEASAPLHDGATDSTDARMRLTLEIGRDIWAWMDLAPALDADCANLPAVMEAVCAKFVAAGYYGRAEVLTEVEAAESTLRFDPARLARGALTHLAYVMEDPILIPAAQQLFAEHGVGQHYSSRALQACFADLGLTGGEIDFDPREIEGNRAVELWTVQKAGSGADG